MVAGSNGFQPPEVREFYLDRASRFGEERIERSEDKLVLRCGHPAHPDVHPSMGFDLVENGRGPQILIYCHSRKCDKDEILAGVGLTMSDLYFDPKRAPVEGCSLEQFARFKGIPVDFLAAEGLKDTEHWGKPAVDIPYSDPEGEYLFSRYRVALRGRTTVVSETGGKVTVPYGLGSLEDGAEAGFLVVCEGESDTLTCWYHSLPAIGVPGGGNWRPEWSSYLNQIPEVLVAVDPDETGERLFSSLLEDPVLRSRLERVELWR
jgi:hypothetical protein